MDIRLKRAYDTAARSDGPRILVDRIWPRGVAKEEADIARWLKGLAPSTELRKVFAAKDTDHNNAVALRDSVLDDRL